MIAFSSTLIQMPCVGVGTDLLVLQHDSSYKTLSYLSFSVEKEITLCVQVGER